MHGPQRNTQSVFGSHDGIIQAIQDRMQFVDGAIDDEASISVRQRHIGLFKVFCSLCHMALCLLNARSLTRGCVGINEKELMITLKN